MSEMSFSHNPMVCRKCEHRWEQQMLQWAPVSVILAHWRSIRCPACGANWKKLSFVTGKENADETA